MPQPVSGSGSGAKPPVTTAFASLLAPLTQGQAVGPPPAASAGPSAVHPQPSSSKAPQAAAHGRSSSQADTDEPETTRKTVTAGSISVDFLPATPPAGPAGRTLRAPTANGRAGENAPTAGAAGSSSSVLGSGDARVAAGPDAPLAPSSALAPDSQQDDGADDADEPSAILLKARGHRPASEDHSASWSAARASTQAPLDSLDTRQSLPTAPAGAMPAEPGPGSGARSPDLAQATAGASPTVDAPNPPPPAAQLGHAVAAFAAAPDGSSQIRILLNPAELGSVQVHITRTQDGLSSVSVAVERPETLRSLQADLGHLHQALDRAGLPEQRNIVLHLAASDTGSGGLPAGGSGFGGGSAQGGSQNTPQGRHEAGAGWQDASMSGTGPAEPDPHPNFTAWQRAGVNITA